MFVLDSCRKHVNIPLSKVCPEIQLLYLQPFRIQLSSPDPHPHATGVRLSQARIQPSAGPWPPCFAAFAPPCLTSILLQLGGARYSP